MIILRQYHEIDIANKVISIQHDGTGGLIHRDGVQTMNLNSLSNSPNYHAPSQTDVPPTGSDVQSFTKTVINADAQQITTTKAPPGNSADYHSKSSTGVPPADTDGKSSTKTPNKSDAIDTTSSDDTSSSTASNTFSSKSLNDDPNHNSTPADNTPGAPTIGQLKEASADAYSPLGPTAPPGWKPFTDANGKQFSINNSNGVTANAWVTDQNKIVIVYEGTNVLNPTSILADLPVALKQNSAGEKDSVDFANEVSQAAKSDGYTSDDVFVTGHSLGGIEAEYVAQQTGLGGASFDATGIPPSATAVGDGKNFTDYLHYGDPVSNYASDASGDGQYKPTDLSHYGNVVFFGDQSAQTELENNANTTNVGGVAADFLKYHATDGIPSDPPYSPPAS